MAYATKYLFKWQSAKGTTREIRVLKNGYSGSVIQRALGRAPILKKQKNGTVFGTSLEFYAECQVEGEFTEFYTTNPKAYKVQLYAGNDLLWQGYVTPELYSEPDIAPPFDVQVIATDGIGELKLYDFGPQGTVSLRSIFTYLLGYTGLGTDVYLISSLKAGSSGAGALLEKTINLDYMAGESCYDVLTYLLDTLHATITWWKGAWIVARETNVTFTSGKVRYFNTAGNSALLAGSVQTLGKMYTNDVWPVGQLSRKVDPAKKSVTVQAPWHVVTAFVNSGMDSDSGWTKANNASFDSAKKAYYLPDNAVPYHGNPAAEISQAVSMGGLRVPMSFSGKFCATELPPFSGATYGGVVGVDVLYVTGNVSYYLTKDDNGDTVWKQGNGGKYDFQIRLSQVNTDEAGAEELTFEVPPLELNNTYPSGTLTFHIVGRSALVFNAFLDIKISKGYQDRLHIDNGARGEEGEYEVAIGRETSDIDYYKAFMQGILLDSGSLITSFKDDAITTGMDFLAFISRDYARSFALPRIVRTGTVQLEAAVQFPPLVLTKAAVDYWLETWSWNMYEDELDITARSLPTASISVDSEVISEASGTTSGGSGGGSSSMSGGGSNYFEPDEDVESAVALKASYVALSAPDFLIGEDRESLTADLDLIGDALGSLQAQIDAVAARDSFDELTATALFADIVSVGDRLALGDAILEWDAEHKAWHLIGNFYADGFVTAGGYSSGGGGGGGASLAAMWETLTNTSSDHTYDSTKIHTAHIPDMASAYGYVKTADISDMATKTWVTAQGYITDSAFDNDFATISAALQSLQSQVDSVAARDGFDELTATAAFVDMLAAGSIIADDAEIGGYSLKAIPNAYLANSAITINGTATALGSSFDTANITAGTAGTSAATTGASFAIPYVTVNKYGIVTGYGTHTHSISQANIFGSSAIGSASLPVYYNGSALTACTASSIFSAMSSSAGTNLSVTVAGQNRTATLYATYDSASENISDKFGIVDSALRSLQAQIDSVASRFDWGQNADLEADENFIVEAFQNLQAQVDSLAAKLEDHTVAGYFDTLAVSGGIYTGTILSAGYVTGGAGASDVRLKQNVRTMPDCLDVVMALRPVRFEWNARATELCPVYKGADVGFVAQEVEALLPSAIGTIFDDYMRLDQTKIIAPLVGAVQDHELRIREIEKRLNAN